MRNYGTAEGAKLEFRLNGQMVHQLQLEDGERMIIRAETYFLLRPGDMIELIENETESKTLSCPVNRIILVKGERVKDNE